jgi:hypothetical protein
MSAFARMLDCFHADASASARSLGCVRADTLASARTPVFYPPGNFIMDATVHLSHRQPSGHRLTIRPSVCYRPHDNPA